MGHFSVVVFDLDGTLSPVNSWTALTDALGAEVSEHRSIYHKYREGRLSYPDAKRQLINLWRTSGRTSRQEFAKIFRSFPLRPEAYELINWLKAQQYVTCLISGSMDLYVATVAKRLGFDCYYANTELVFNGAGDLVDMHYFLDQGSKKVEHMRELCQLYDVSPNEVVAIGDSENDLGLFEYTGNGVLVDAVHSDQLMDRAWRVIRTLGEVKSLLA